ncbi:MAG: hypothetical protein K2N28_02495 [Muribaculaceae bacterium]|nr:hypothetical protein [Muribaculaceae bacterium]
MANIYKYKIVIVCIGFALSLNLWAQGKESSACNDISPLKIERTAGGAEHYSIDYKALDINRADYSDAFEIYMTPLDGRLYEDCTQQFIDGKISLDPQFFSCAESPVNGVLGNDFSRIEIYTYPDVVRTDSVTYAVRGRTKVKSVVRDFAGEIKIKKIYFMPDADYLDYYVIIADYSLREDTAQKDSGEFKGIFGAYGYIDSAAPDLLQVDDRNSVADSYENRTYVGTWQSYDNPNEAKRCVWGDYRLPFCFDFDIGAGDIMVNPEYKSPEWDRYMQWGDFEVIETENGERRTVYKNPWW